jgi:hypothetical protein
MQRLLLFSILAATALADPLPVRGIHLAAPQPGDMELALRFIREALPKEGVNTLVLEFNYHYRFSSHPEIIDEPALSRQDLENLAAACRQAGIRLIPMINLLGHQSWAKTTFGLLRAHPEFDETPGKYPDNQGIYCRSYCPLHPDIHNVLFDLINELMEATGAADFHAGMDEVFLLGEDDCPRCRGRDRAELFAGEVKTLRDFLARRGARLWIWGDRLLDADLTGIGKWEAAENGTARAINLIPRDVVICDWHYEAPHPTATFFALQGLPVVSSPWRRPSVALEQLHLIRRARATAAPPVAQRLLGMLQTTWVGFGPFVRAYFGEDKAPLPQVTEAVLCFRELFRELRRMD